MNPNQADPTASANPQPFQPAPDTPPVMQPTLQPQLQPKPKSRKLMFSIFALIIVIAIAGVVFGTLTFLNNHDLTTSVDTASYTKVASIQGVTFWMPKQWTAPNISTYDHIDAFNGQSKVATYEIQLYFEDTYSTKQLSKEEVLSTNDPSSVEGLQLYHVNGKLIADYIQKGTGNALDQRIILIRNAAGTKQLRVTINRTDNSRLTKDNFDGLMQLVGSIAFN